MAKASNLEDTFNKLEAVLNEMEQGELTFCLLYTSPSPRDTR